MLAPLALRPNSPRHVLSKVHRSPIHLSRFEFFKNHIVEKNNAFADFLTRWSKGYRSASAHTNLIAALYHDIIPTLIDTAALSVTDIKRDQENYATPTKAVKNIEGVYQMSGKIWIRNEATGMKLKIAVPFNCGETRHRAYTTNMDTIDREYW